MNPEEQLLVLLGMTEQQQKTITAAVEELKKQTASLNGIAPELQKPYRGRLWYLWPEVWGTCQKKPRAPSKRP